MTVTKIQSIPKITITKVRIHTKNFFFWPHDSMWDLSSPVLAPCSGSTESKTLDHQGSPPTYFSVNLKLLKKIKPIC